MSVKFKDDFQKEHINQILDYMMDNYSAQLQSNNIATPYYEMTYNDGGNVDNWTTILNEIFPGEGFGTRFFMPPIARALLGKFTELIIRDLDGGLLTKLIEIPRFAFYGCDLVEITLPGDLELIHPGAFYHSKIRTINFLGTETQWEALAQRNADAIVANRDYEKWDVLDYSMDPSVGDVDSTIFSSTVINCSDKKDIYRDFRLNHNKATVTEAMTRREVLFKRNVLQYLSEEGFPTFAKYLKNFHFNFLTSKEAGRPFVAAIAADRGIVLVNPEVDADAISMLLRHEAGHSIFKHNEHLFAKLKKLGIDTPSELAYELLNEVGDYHISNMLYDEDDYYTAKHINVDGGTFAGLVTELDFPDHPEYWTMDFDQLWDVFVKDYNRDDLAKETLKNEAEAKKSDDYVEGYNRLIDDYNAGKITKEQISRWLNSRK